MTRRFAAIIATWICALASPTGADAPSIDALKHRAEQAYEHHQYIGARLALLQAIAIEPRGELWFALGQADYNLGLYSDAIDAWKRYLDTQPGEDDAARAQQAIGAANAKMRTPLPVMPPPLPSYERRWDVTGTLVVASGIVVAGAGGVALYHAHAQGQDMTGTLDDYDQRNHRARLWQVAGFGAIGLGAAAVVGAIWRWRGHYEEVPHVEVTASGSSVGVAVGGRL